MNQTPVNNLKLGIFVSVGLLLFVAGIYLVGQRQQLFSGTFSIKGIFSDINGLQIGNNVRFSGINVGVVSSITQITDTSVRVDMQINDDTKKFIKKNVVAIIGSDGLMGSKLLILVPGGSGQQTIADNDVIATRQPVGMDDILISVQETAENASMITADLALVMRNIREGKGTVGKIMMDSSFARNIDNTLINLKQGTKGFKTNMDAASHNILLRGFLKKKKKQEE